MKKRVDVFNEWDPLEEIIIGTAVNAKFPPDDPTLNYSRKSIYATNVPPNIPDYIIEETEEDLILFGDALKKLGVMVNKPDSIDTNLEIKTPHWKSQMYFNYCPRDILLAIGDTIIETPGVMRSRYFETFAYRNLLMEYFKSGSKWFAAPKPFLKENSFNFTSTNEDAPSLNNYEPIFDAANILRAGEDLFYLCSNSGNKLGYDWLKSIIGEKYNIHLCENLYDGIHIDTTIVLLRPGLILANPERVSKDNLPPLLKQWDIIYAPPMVEYQYSELPPFSSIWLGMNVLMVNPGLAVVDAHQTELIRLLARKDIESLPLILRHGRTLGGGFHCTTLDVRRKGVKESYW